MKKHICFKNKNLIFKYIKLILDYGKDFVYEPIDIELKNFINSCIQVHEILKESIFLKDKYNLNTKKYTKEKLIEKQIEGVSTILRRYAIELNKNTEANIEEIYKFKNLILNSGYTLINFEVNLMTSDFLLIDLCINSKDQIICNLLKIYSESAFSRKTQVTNYKISEDYTYFYISNKTTYNINYGVASLAKDGTNLSGDNTLIKNLPNGKFIACLSDGMGSGYFAWNESIKTLALIDNITKSNISSDSSINILNTFYSLKDQVETYATLDFIEINKINGEATFYKLGTTDTYIVRKNSELEKLENDHLPFGIEDLITEKKVILEDSELVLLFSDGIIEKINNIEQFEQFVRFISKKTPQIIATDIISYLLKQMNNKVFDDMSLIVLKVEKSNN